MPAPDDRMPDLDTELRRIRATPAAQLRADLDRLTHLGAPLRQLYSQPREGLRRIADALRQCHEMIVAPHWTRMSRLLQADIAHPRCAARGRTGQHPPRRPGGVASAHRPGRGVARQGFHPGLTRSTSPLMGMREKVLVDVYQLRDGRTTVGECLSQPSCCAVVLGLSSWR